MPTPLILDVFTFLFISLWYFGVNILASVLRVPRQSKVKFWFLHSSDHLCLKLICLKSAKISKGILSSTFFTLFVCVPELRLNQLIDIWNTYFKITIMLKCWYIFCLPTAKYEVQRGARSNLVTLALNQLPPKKIHKTQKQEQSAGWSSLNMSTLNRSYEDLDMIF